MSGKTSVSLIAILATLAPCLAPSLAQAASGARIEQVSGEAITLGSKGATPAKPGQTLVRGDRIVVRSGQASLVYADSCKVKVKAGAMVTVAAASPCAGGAGVVASQQADAAAFTDMLGHLDAQTILAGAGTAVLLTAVILAVVNPDDRCDPQFKLDCPASN